MGYLAARLTRLEHAAAARRAGDCRPSAAEAELRALTACDPEALRLVRQLARRMLGRPDNVPWEPADLVALGTAELRRRLDDRLRAARGAAAL